jgi:nitroreductase
VAQTRTFINLLRNRRSIRQFKQQMLPLDTVEQLQEALLRAPSSRGRNPWNFTFIDNRDLLEKISRAKKHGSAFIANAALGVIVCADESISDVWIEDCAIAAITLQYAAQDLDLGSCWAQIRNRPHDNDTSAEDYLKNLLCLEKNYKILCVIGIGFADEKKPGHAQAELSNDKIKQVNKIP